MKILTIQNETLFCMKNEQKWTIQFTIFYNRISERTVGGEEWERIKMNEKEWARKGERERDRGKKLKVIEKNNEKGMKRKGREGKVLKNGKLTVENERG